MKTGIAEWSAHRIGKIKFNSEWIGNGGKLITSRPSRWKHSGSRQSLQKFLKRPSIYIAVKRFRRSQLFATAFFGVVKPYIFM